MARSIIKEIRISQSEDVIFDALITPSLIKKWWIASRLIIIPDSDGLNMTIWDDDESHTDYISEVKIKELTRPHRLLLTNLKYASRYFHAHLQDSSTEFTIHKENDQVKLVMKQTGFPDDEACDEFYNSCSSRWDESLLTLKRVAETEM